MQSLQSGIDNYLSDRNLPTVELRAKELFRASAAYGGSKLTVDAGNT
jgi:hypothetical protein